MTPDQFQATLGRPKSVRPTEYAAGVKGPKGHWYYYEFNDAQFHMLFITVDTGGRVVKVRENIIFAKYADGSGDSANLSEPDPDQTNGYVVEGKLYDMSGNKLDLKEWLEDAIERYERDQGG